MDKFVKRYINCIFCEKGKMQTTKDNTFYCTSCLQEVDPIQLCMRVKNISYEKAIDHILNTKDNT